MPTIPPLDPARLLIYKQRVAELKLKLAQEKEQAAQDLSALYAELERRALASSPVQWCEQVCGDFLWSKQREIINAVRDHRRVIVPTCHEIGKSFISSRIAGWWIMSHPPGEAFVVTSAPTGRQVRNILWREIGRMHARAKLSGRVNQTEWWLNMPAGNEEIVAFGQKPAAMDPAAFQGIHAKYVLVLFDEACGIEETLWNAADSLIANEFSHFVGVGNPDDPLSEFAKNAKDPSWHTIHVGAFDTPAFTGEQVPKELLHLLISKTWVEEKRKKWGETNPLYISKILGQFPEDNNPDALIPMSWISRAQQRWEAAEKLESNINELGVDVGGGGDESTIAQKKGIRVKIVFTSHDPDTMNTAQATKDTHKATKAQHIKVDRIGIGRGVADWLIGQQLPAHGIDVGQAPRETKYQADDDFGYINLRAQLWWYVRTLFECGNIAIDPEDDDLAAELARIRYFRTSGSKIQIESKQAAKERGEESPNRAEALMLACAPEYAYSDFRQSRATWGRRSKAS